MFNREPLFDHYRTRGRRDFGRQFSRKGNLYGRELCMLGCILRFLHHIAELGFGIAETQPT